MRCTSADIYTLDTNVLVYSVDRTAGPRHDLAKQIMSRAASGPCCLTLQSVSEFFAVATRKGMMGATEAAGVTESMIDLFPTAAASAGSVRTALATAASGRASYWDALLVITAAEAGFADDSTFAGVRAINPFAGTSLSAAAEALLTLD